MRPLFRVAKVALHRFPLTVKLAEIGQSNTPVTQAERNI